MKLYFKDICIIILIALLILLSFFATDFILVKNKKSPIFCKRETEYWDGGSFECYGAFYKVNVYKNINGKIEYAEIGNYNLKFDKTKIEKNN